MSSNYNGEDHSVNNKNLPFVYFSFKDLSEKFVQMKVNK